MQFEDYHIYCGHHFSKNELKSRLHQMEIDFDNYNPNKQYFVDLYDKALERDLNKQIIQNYLKRDTMEYLTTKNKKTRDSFDECEEIIIPEGLKMEKNITQVGNGN
jgi:hypothetical protein